MAAPSAVSIWCIVDRVRPGEEPPSVGCFASPGQAGRRRGQRLVRRMEIWTLVRTRCRSGTKGRCRQTRCRSGTKGRCRQTSLGATERQNPPAAAQLALAGYARRAEPPKGGSARLANCAAAVRRWSEPARAPRKSKNAHPNQRDTKFGEARPSRGVHQTVVGVRTPYSSFFATPTSEVPPGGSPGGRSAKFPASRPADVGVAKKMNKGVRTPTTSQCPPSPPPPRRRSRRHA